MAFKKAKGYVIVSTSEHTYILNVQEFTIMTLIGRIKWLNQSFGSTK